MSTFSAITTLNIIKHHTVQGFMTANKKLEQEINKNQMCLSFFKPNFAFSSENDTFRCFSTQDKNYETLETMIQVCLVFKSN